MSYVVLDLETRDSFQDVRVFDPARLTISVVGVITAEDDREYAYRVEELSALETLLRQAPCVIGYNLLGFDYAVLKPAFAQLNPASPLDPYTLPTIDLFDHLQRALGFRPKLDDVAKATLGKGKSGDGLQAIRLYQEGNWDALIRYCLDDVRITRDVYEYGLTRGYVKFPMRNGMIADIKATWVPQPEQAKLF